MKYLIFCVLWCLSSLGHAHQASDSYLTLNADEDGRLDVRWDIALRDLALLVDLDADHNRQLTWGEVDSHSLELQQLVQHNLQFRRDQRACAPFQFQPLAIDAHVDGQYAVFQLHTSCAAQGQWAVQYRLLAGLDAGHRGIVVWQWQKQPAQTLVLAAADKFVALDQVYSAQSLVNFWYEGVAHIWSGYDHILFLLSLLLPVALVRRQHVWHGRDDWQSALWDAGAIVTAFTLAHSITLVLAALQLVYLPSRWVESAIAASVVIAALNNLWPVLNHWRWLMAFVFGLIHGFGFASALADLTAGSEARLWALVGFNLGVESGQLAIVLLFVPLAYRWRDSHYYQRWLLAGGSLAIASVAGLWLCQRLFNLELIVG